MSEQTAVVHELSAQLQTLRDERDRLRRALEIIACGTEDKVPPYRCIDFAMAKRIAQAALTPVEGGQDE